MKKIFLTFGVFVCITCPLFADGAGVVTVDNTTVPSTVAAVEDAGCDNDTLHMTSGDANLKAVWRANSINLVWNANGGTMTEEVNGETVTVTTKTGTCVYDTAITLPPTPTREGYTFAGWDVTSVT